MPYIARRRKLPPRDWGILVPIVFNKNFTLQSGFNASYEQRGVSYELIFWQGEVCRARNAGIGGDRHSSFDDWMRVGKQQWRGRRRRQYRVQQSKLERTLCVHAARFRASP